MKDRNTDAFEGGLIMLWLGGTALAFWGMLMYYDIPDWFERDGVWTAFAVWKWVAIAEMIFGGIGLFEAGRQRLAGEAKKATGGKIFSSIDWFTAGMSWIIAIMHSGIFFVGVLVFAHWAWFAVVVVLSIIIAMVKIGSGTPDVGVCRDDEKKGKDVRK